MRKSLIIAAAIIMASTPAVSHAKTLEDLLVEKGVITKGEAKGATNSAASKVYWNDGTRFEFPDNGFTSGFATYLETRYQFTDNDEEFGGKNTSSFEFTKARIIISGTAMHNEFSYYLMPDFVGSKDGTSANGVNLQDAWIAWNACDWANVKMGQYKTFVSRQFNTADWKKLMPDNSIASNYFNAGRNQGLSGEGTFEDGMFNVKAGIFNGSSNYGKDGSEGINQPGRDVNHSAFVAVRYNPIGQMDAYEESDVNYTEDVALSFGAAYGFDKSKFSGTGVFPERDLNLISADANLKWHGLSVNLEYFYAHIDPKNTDENVQPQGFYAQAGYFLMPKKLELAARYSLIDCDSGKGVGICSGLDNINEAGAALNYYLWKHNLKASLAYVYNNFEPEASNSDSYDQNKIIFQVSSYF